ncbi:MAG: class I SAM-dependent methyltransferase [Balneolaceae bacterium]
MKEAKDRFSKQSDAYKTFRPAYPPELFEILFDLFGSRNECWDCATGNGQAAVELSNYFRHVYATDISRNQIQNAEARENITYSIARAEESGFSDDKFDLITVAQAIHWFDLDAFGREVRRVSKNGGVLAVWGYGLLKIDPDIDPIIDDFYRKKIGPYWDGERKHIDSAYQTIEYNFTEITPDYDLSINEYWSLNRLEGYLSSWSSVQNYIQQNPSENPVDVIIEKVREHWSDDTVKEVRFPVFLRIWEIDK